MVKNASIGNALPAGIFFYVINITFSRNPVESALRQEVKNVLIFKDAILKNTPISMTKRSSTYPKLYLDRASFLL
jgi:hypothetical protein